MRRLGVFKMTARVPDGAEKTVWKEWLVYLAKEKIVEKMEEDVILV